MTAVATNLNQVYQAIGTLTANVEGLREDIQRAEKTRVADNDVANASRNVMQQRVGELAQEMQVVQSHIHTLQADVRDAKSVTDDVKRWRQMGIGALAIVGIGASALTWLVAHYFDPIVRFFFRGH